MLLAARVYWGKKEAFTWVSAWVARLEGSQEGPGGVSTCTSAHALADTLAAGRTELSKGLHEERDRGWTPV